MEDSWDFTIETWCLEESRKCNVYGSFAFTLYSGVGRIKG